MPQSAFRNLLDTQYETPNLDAQGKRVKGTHFVAKAYLTYEEVLKQIEMNFCQEEVDIFIAYLSSMRLPYRQEQIIKIKKSELREKRKAAKYAREHPLPTREEIMKANNINPEDYAKGLPRLWNGVVPTKESYQLKGEIKKVKENE